MDNHETTIYYKLQNKAKKMQKEIMAATEVHSVNVNSLTLRSVSENNRIIVTIWVKI